MACGGFCITAGACLPVLAGVIVGGEGMAGFGSCIAARAALFPVIIAITCCAEGVAAFGTGGAANGAYLPVIVRVCGIRRAIRV